MAVQTKSPRGIAKHLFDVTEYHRMAEAGILLEDDPVELINGELVEKGARGITQRLFNVEEYHRLADAGILLEDDRVELINGEIIEMSPIGSRHQSCVEELDALLHRVLGASVRIRVQGPIQLGESGEPQPDITLLKPRKDRYAYAHPRPADVLLVIEVADTSIEYDRSVKLPLYAQAGIPEAWLIDLNQDIIGSFGEPRDGQYQFYRQLRRGEMIASTILPTLTLAVDDILG